MPFAARTKDMHLCPMLNGSVPHLAGTIVAGCPSVLIGNSPAARSGDSCTCMGPPNKIAKGSSTVLIGNKPAARVGDTTSHGGAIVTGCPNVIIGG